MFNKILVATDRPLECDESVLSATRIAQNDNAKLLILHVLKSDSSMYRNFVKHYRTGEEIVCDESYKAEVKEALYKNCSDELTSIDNLEIQIASGVPWMKILRWARKENVDLIILGAHTGKADNIEKDHPALEVGRTAEGVIKHERCPVMITNQPIRQSKVVFKKVMVSIDFSPSCVSAFQFAMDLAEKRGSRLYLFHMLPIPYQPKPSQAQYDLDIQKIRHRLEDEFRFKISNTIRAEIDTWGGTYPGVEILKAARRKDVDIIVMGSHTKIKEKDGSKWYVGSAVQRVSANSVCPVAVITDPKVLEKWERG